MGTTTGNEVAALYSAAFPGTCTTVPESCSAAEGPVPCAPVSLRSAVNLELDRGMPHFLKCILSAHIHLLQVIQKMAL